MTIKVQTVLNTGVNPRAVSIHQGGMTYCSMNEPSPPDE